MRSRLRAERRGNAANSGSLRPRIYGEDDLYVSAWSAMLEFDEEGADAAALVAFSDLLGLSEVDLRTRDAFRDFGRQALTSALLRSH